MPETRKIQGIGNTLYVSLPKYWTKMIQLKQGDKVMIIPLADNAIGIYPAATREKPREIILEINEKSSIESIKREIIAAYIDGFDTIILNSEERIAKKNQETIRDIVNRLFGLEIIEISRDAITIQCLLKRTMPIDKTIQRIHNVISPMFREIVAALKEQNADLNSSLNERMHDVRRLSLVTNRLLRSLVLFPTPENKMSMSLIDCVDYLKILHIISEIACDVDKILGSVAVLNKQALPNHILEPLYQVCVTIGHSFDKSVQSLLSKDILLANQLIDTMPASKLNLEELWKICRELDSSKFSNLVFSHIYLLIDCLKRIQQHSVDIAEVAIDLAEAATVNSQNIKK